MVCNPRKNALLKDGNKNDHIDARKLAELLRGNQLKPVYHGETGVRMLRVALCGAAGVKTKILCTKKKGPGCKHRSRSHGEQWRSVFA